MWNAAGDLSKARWWAKLQLDHTQIQNRATEYEIHHSPLPAKEIQNAIKVPIQHLEKSLPADPKYGIPHMTAYHYVVDHTTTSTPQFWLQHHPQNGQNEIFISFLTGDAKKMVRVLQPTSEPGGRQSVPASEYMRAAATTPFTAVFDAATSPIQIPVIMAVSEAFKNVQ